jgi:hypothetical protein
MSWNTAIQFNKLYQAYLSLSASAIKNPLTADVALAGYNLTNGGNIVSNQFITLPATYTNQASVNLPTNTVGYVIINGSTATAVYLPSSTGVYGVGTRVIINNNTVAQTVSVNNNSATTVLFNLLVGGICECILTQSSGPDGTWDIHSWNPSSCQFGANSFSYSGNSMLMTGSSAKTIGVSGTGALSITSGDALTLNGPSSYNVKYRLGTAPSVTDLNYIGGVQTVTTFVLNGGTAPVMGVGGSQGVVTSISGAAGNIPNGTYLINFGIGMSNTGGLTGIFTFSITLDLAQTLYLTPDTQIFLPAGSSASPYSGSGSRSTTLVVTSAIAGVFLVGRFGTSGFAGSGAGLDMDRPYLQLIRIA